jgi:hypothetical protein
MDGQHDGGNGAVGTMIAVFANRVILPNAGGWRLPAQGRAFAPFRD